MPPTFERSTSKTSSYTSRWREAWRSPIFWIYAIALTCFYLGIFTWEGGYRELIGTYGIFFLLGVVGALVANSTGAGGGVIFIPFFSAINFTAVESVATSIAIQCCGMTMGAISWLRKLTVSYIEEIDSLKTIKVFLLICTIPTIAGVLIGQHFIKPQDLVVADFFRVFSIIFGTILLIFTFRSKKRVNIKRCLPSLVETLLLIMICLVGGIITAWISIGVGELVALFLFFRRYSAKLAVAIGVCASSVAVLVGLIEHTLYNSNVSVEVFLFAGQGALIGGYLARNITQMLGGYYLKLFFAVWIIVTGIAMG